MKEPCVYHTFLETGGNCVDCGVSFITTTNTMNPICNKCGSDETYIENPRIEKEPPRLTLDDMRNQNQTTLGYKTTTWVCKKCGYSVTY